MKKWFRSISYTRIIALSFFVVILTGAILLSLPIASKSGAFTPFIKALFTATSATCVTGLIVYDTFTHWSLFGQIVIITMIQIGGLGLMTIITMFFLLTKKKINLHERQILAQSAGTMHISGVLRLIRHIVIGTLCIEMIGAILLSVRFIPMLGIGTGIYTSIFHSISAFCNAGFDLMGRYEPFSSLTSFETDWYVNLIIMSLIIIGGIGFLVWNDISVHKHHIRNYRLHSKIVLVTTVILLVSGTIGFLIFEYNGNLKELAPGHKILSSAFMSVTTRTAGFNTMNLATLSQAGVLLSVLLMTIGGSPGSTAGGIKTTTIAVIFLTIKSLSLGKEDVEIGRKRLENNLVRQAAVIVILYVIAITISTMIICHVEQLDISTVLFETSSAIGTVGLTQGITPSLSSISHIILIILMYGGRIGAFSLMLVFGEKKKRAPTQRPSEKLLIG